MVHRYLFILAAFFSFPATVLGSTGVIRHNHENSVVFSERWQQHHPDAKDLFFEPQTAFEEKLLKTGRLLFWKSYSGRSLRGQANPNENLPFRGYILFADPFHYGMKRISFLLGSDCSHFIHRIFQALGAPYPFAKTRNFIALANYLQQNRLTADEFYQRHFRTKGLMELSPCHWRKLTESFALVGPTSQISTDLLEPGDILVIKKKRSWRGPHGHMAIIKSISPLQLLHAKNAQAGVVEEGINNLPRNAFVFRYRKTLHKMKIHNAAIDWRNIHALSYAADPSGCR